MTSSELVVVGERDELDNPAAVVLQLRSARADLESASPELLSQIELWSATLLAAAKVQRAERVVREATETRIRCERQIGRALVAGLSVPGDRSSLVTWTLKALASAPDSMFEEAVSDMIEHRMNCIPRAVVKRCEYQSLKKIQTGIFQAYTGVYFLQPSKLKKPKPAPRVDTLERAKETLREAEGLKKEGQTREGLLLDSIHADARRFAQALSNYQTLSGIDFAPEVKTKLARAEHLAGEIAELVYSAWRLEQV